MTRYGPRPAPALAAILLLTLLASILSAAQKAEIAFNHPQQLRPFLIAGTAELDASQNAPGNRGKGSLKVSPDARVELKLRDKDQSGRISFQVFEAGNAPNDPEQRAAGPLWGLLQCDGRILVVGPIYAPFLDGAKTYAVTEFVPNTDDRPYYHPKYLGVKREGGWHRWTFDFDARKGLSILHNGTDVNALKPRFDWNESQMRGFVGLVILGDSSGTGQTLWIDDLEVELGGPMRVGRN